MSHTSPRNESAEELVNRVKEELRDRYAHDERPEAHEYFERFPRLCEDRDLAVSVIYEEFCLLEEVGRRLDLEQFCRRYPRWRHSLELQLRVDSELREIAGRVSSPSPLPQPGDLFQGFRIDSILGRGGTSHVYLAHEEAMGDRVVALKVSPDRGPEPDIIGCLDHPRIMPAFSVCRDPARGLRGLCMPYRSGMPLHELARRSWPRRDSHGASAMWAVLAAQDDAVAAHSPSLNWPGWFGFPLHGSYEEGVAWIVFAVAQAVCHIHSCGVIHCDIKPSNIYVAARDGPYLFDFGFARSQRERGGLRGGTLVYMAPEQLNALLDPRHWTDVGPAVDIYALGLTLVELLLGEPPDVLSRNLSESQAARELLHQRSRPTWPTQIASRMSAAALADIVERCLAPCTDGKYTDASDVVRSLRRFLGVCPSIAFRKRGSNNRVACGTRSPDLARLSDE